MSVDSLELTRLLKAPPARVFAAFTEKALLQGWFGPEGTTVPRCDVDARVGGRYRIELHSPAGAVHIVTGEFKEVAAPERLVYSWGWLDGAGRGPETIVTVTFREKDGGTELRLVQSGFASEEARANHAHGWTSSWTCLDDLLEGRAKSQTPRPIIMGPEPSTYVQSARIAFAEKGVAYSMEIVRPQTPEILEKNPFGKVPVFRCGELTLYETSAIMRYLNETFPGPALMPGKAASRARAEQWISAINCYGYPAIVRNYTLQYFFPRGADGKPDRGVIEAALPEIDKLLGALDAAYGPNDYLVDDTLCLADILLAPQIRYLSMFPEGEELLGKRLNVRRAHKKFAARASFLEATAAPPPQAARH